MGNTNTKYTSNLEELFSNEKFHIHVEHFPFFPCFIKISFQNTVCVKMTIQDEYLEVFELKIFKEEMDVLDKIIFFAKKENIQRILFPEDCVMYETDIYSPYYGEYYDLNMSVFNILKSEKTFLQEKGFQAKNTEHNHEYNQMFLSLPINDLIDIYIQKYYYNPLFTCCHDLGTPFRDSIRRFITWNYDSEEMRDKSVRNIFKAFTVKEFFQLFDKKYMPIVREITIKRNPYNGIDDYNSKEKEIIQFMYDICNLVNCIPELRYPNSKGDDTDEPLLRIDQKTFLSL